jgi:glycerophosphoryl diester phosphodiesterase
MNGSTFVLVGHRGAMEHAPENSIESFLLAEQSGADELELDIRASSDGVPIVLHDPTLARVAAAPGPLTNIPVGDLALAELLTVTLDSGRPVPTFAEVLDATTAALQVEIKAIDAVPAVAKMLAERPAAAARVSFTSFLPEALLLLRALAPHIRRGLILGEWDHAKQHDGLNDVLADTGATALYCGIDTLTEERVERLQDQGIAVHAWPLRCEADMLRALSLGVNGGTSDDPGAAREWFLDAMAQRLVGAGT